jgi:hypothetical protein
LRHGADDGSSCAEAFVGWIWAGPPEYPDSDVAGMITRVGGDGRRHAWLAPVVRVDRSASGVASVLYAVAGLLAGGALGASCRRRRVPCWPD